MMTSMLTVLSLFHLVLNVQAGVALQHRQEPEVRSFATMCEGCLRILVMLVILSVTVSDVI
jgi:hypothetical protein